MCVMRWCYTAVKRAATAAAADRICCALTSIHQLHTLWIYPPLSSFDMHVRPTLAVNMLTAALVGELSCCGRIWASCSGCLSEVCTVTLVIFHCWWYIRTCGAHRQSN